MTFLFAIAGLTILVALCVWFGLLDKEASPETRRWAQTGLSSLLTGVIAFIAGQKFGAKSR